MLIVLNNKSNLTMSEFKNYYQELIRIKRNSHELVLCPSFLNIAFVSSKDISLGSQTVSKYRMGAYTGEVSATQLLDANADYCIAGHSERRLLDHETNEDVNEQVKQLLEVGITPILCIGETKEERDNNIYLDVIMKQLEEGLLGLTNESSVVIAYEPVWSIGTGEVPTNDQIEYVIQSIKEVLLNNKVLYGGSVNENNIDEIKKIDIIDGYLLGGLSLKPKELELFIHKL